MKEIVIKIDDGLYKLIMSMDKALATTPIRPIIFDAIHNGKVLPKGHGRLIDADTLADGFEDDYEFCEALNATPTLVEADKEE